MQVLQDAETKLAHAPHEHKAELRLWLRLLTCTTLVEGTIRTRLRESFGVTLPRFDAMAQLEAAPGGLTMSALSRRMMVSNGNVTGLVERLVSEGLVARDQAAPDRRTVTVRLTDAGRRDFAVMASAHEGWVADAFAQVSPAERDVLMQLLGQLKASVRSAG